MAVPAARPNEDARLYAGEVIGALGTANGRIVDGAAFYNDVRKRSQ